jgi:CRISPR-associated protein Cmr5
MQTRDQKYAAQIYKQVSAVKEDNNIKDKRYGALAHKLPVLIRTAGLAQALAFLEARGKDEGKKLIEHLNAVVMNGNKNLLASSRESELSEYMYLTQQVLAALLWYKRFAQSVLHVEASDEEEA